MSVYSRRLAGPMQVAIGPGGTVMYTCPPGKVAVLKSVHTHDSANSGDSTAFNLGINSGATANRIYTLQRTVQALNNSVQEGPLYAVITEGETFVGSRGGVAGGVHTLFGYELDAL